MRPRKHDTGLPPCVYHKHGAYYKVVRGVWHRLGSSRADVDASLSRLPPKLDAYHGRVLQHAYSVLGKARQNARTGRRPIPFELVRDDVHRLLNESGWCCAVSGAAFSMETINGKRPFAPSIDRIDSTKGYSLGNCRMVCMAVNIALNVWGEQVIWQLFAKRGGASLIRQVLVSGQNIE